MTCRAPTQRCKCLIFLSFPPLSRCFSLSRSLCLSLALSDRPQAHSDESRLANLLRRMSREDDRDRRLATLKQMRELIVHSENKVVSFGTQHQSVPASDTMAFTAESFVVLDWSCLVWWMCFWLFLVISGGCLLQVLVKQLDTILNTLNDILNERCGIYIFIFGRMSSRVFFD